ncbi:MAG: caspase family protein [Candidatus Neomarinimicrobiota bacterium]
MRNIYTLNPFCWWIRFITISLLTSYVLGQGYDIGGRTFDDSGKKVGPVRIVLYDQLKKQVAQIETPANGKFRMKNIPDGNYTMNIYGPDGYGVTQEIIISGSSQDALEPKLNINRDQVQIKIEPAGNGASLNWQSIPNASEYIVYRDNNEIGTVTETFYLDEVEPGKTYAYNITAVKTDKTLGKRSITEYGKALMAPPDNLSVKGKKNTVTLSWDAIEDATGYAIYRDDERINSTPDNSYIDFQLKYEIEYSYTVATLDHHSDEGNKSASAFASTHPEIPKVKGLKAESGENQVVLNWKSTENSIQYYIYQNGALVDSTTNLTSNVQTEAGTENCFTVAGVDKYGSVGTKSDAECDKSQFSPPDSISVTNDKRNNNLIEWSFVEGAISYNLYANDKLQTNTTKNTINLKRLKWDTEYSYYLTSLTEDGVEGPKSPVYTVRTPKTYFIEGLLIDETGDEKNVDQAKVFLYDSSGTELMGDDIVSKNGKFRLDNEIISNHYTIMVYGNGSGNGGERVQVENNDIEDMRISLSTDGLRSEVWVERGVGQLTVHWSDIPQAKSYNIYKNDRLIQNIANDTSYADIVAPGVPTAYMVRSIDLYDLEGPTSNTVTEKASYPPPELSISVIAGGYAIEGSGRIINLSWPAVPGVNKYALYRDGELLSKQAELLYEEKELEWNTTYIYAINSIDAEDIEGVNFIDTVVTHPEVTAPIFKLAGKVNSIEINWDAIPGMAGKYKIFRNGGNIADLDALSFIDPLTPGTEYCYTVAAEDTFKTVGPEAEIQCAKGYFAPPGNFFGKVLRNYVAFTWEPVLAASGYRIYRDNELILDTPDKTELVDIDLEFEKYYTYEACSYDQDGDEGPRISYPLSTHEKVLAVGLNAEANLERISLNWEKSKLKVDHTYRIYRDGELLTGTTDTAYVDVVPPGKFYCYEIKVVDKYNTEGPSSNSECKKILVNYPRMLQVTGDVRRVIFSFKQMVGAVAYNIYQVDKETDSLTFLKKTRSTYYEDKGLEFDTEYCYQIASEDGDGDEGPRSETMCGYVLPPPHLTLIEKRFMENTGNGMLDGRENGWAIFKIVNDGRSPARELKPWLKPEEGAVTPSLKIDSVDVIPILAVGDTIQIAFSIYAKLKIESGERNFFFRVEEFSGQSLEPEPISFPTLKVTPPNLVVTDFSIDSEWGQHYIPKNEVVKMTIRVQNLSMGLTDTASIKFTRDSLFLYDDVDELHEFGLIAGGEKIDLSFEVMTREDDFTVELELYDYFETRKTVPIYVETMKTYKGEEDLVYYETPFPKDISIGEEKFSPEIVNDIPRVSLDNETIGIVLGNTSFWDSTIVSKASTQENVRNVREYFHDLFGLSDHEIVPSQYWFFNDGISSSDFRSIFDPSVGYIKRKIISNLDYSDKKNLDIIIYYSGEGTTYNGEKVLIPYDASFTKSTTFFSIRRLYSDLLDIKSIPEVGNITLFMDVDFNNPAFDQNLVKSTENLDKKKKKKKKGKGDDTIMALPKEIMPPEGLTVFFASNTTQLAYEHPNHESSMFTYYLLKGLKGEADNGDKKVTVSELHDYVMKNVEDTTKTLFNDLPQIPILFTSDPNRVLYKLP